MKKVNGFKASWNEMSDIIHGMKNALTVLDGSMFLTKKAMKRIVEGLEKIDKCINKIANGKP